MQWAPQQQAALEAASQWFAEKRETVFRLFGYAGTGKTTLAKELAAQIPGTVLYACYTGKAAHVMQQKGCAGACTIHSLIYVPKDKSKERLHELEIELAKLIESGVGFSEQNMLELQITAEKANLKRPMFALNEESNIRGADLVIIDEVSMVGMRMGEDLLSFNRPMLVLGDPAQLPPVADGGYFTKGKPDVLLTEVHRQATESPVLLMASRVRESLPLVHKDYGHGSRVINRGTLTIQDVAAFDQVIVGKNHTRRVINRRLRKEMFGRESHLPQLGDKLVCLRNDSEVGLLNGSLWTVLFSEEVDEDYIALHVRDFDREDGPVLQVTAHRAIFEDREIAFWDKKSAQEFDFGYALTCHKSQGSQWDKVLVIDESPVFREHAKSWLYTAITRAAKEVTIVR